MQSLVPFREKQEDLIKLHHGRKSKNCYHISLQQTDPLHFRFFRSAQLSKALGEPKPEPEAVSSSANMEVELAMERWPGLKEGL